MTHICELAWKGTQCGWCIHSKPHEPTDQYCGETCKVPNECYQTGTVCRCVPIEEKKP